MLIPRPTYNESDESEESNDTINPYVTAKWLKFWNVPDWKCDKCEAIMFGRVEECVYCKFRLNTRTPRPISWTEDY